MRQGTVYRRFDGAEIGYRSAMNEAPKIWQWECPAPVRADAESMFVPSSALPEAAVGDIVRVKGGAGSEERTGTITAISEGDDELFFRLTLEP
jgi:hypothetical protein